MEIVGEFLGIDAEKGLYAYFKPVPLGYAEYAADRVVLTVHQVHPPLQPCSSEGCSQGVPRSAQS
jgi:hypothetical protein